MLLMTLAAPACAKAQPQRQPEPQVEALPPVPTLPIQPLAGKTVGVLPLTLLGADPTLQSDPTYAQYQDRRGGLHRADSLISDALVRRAPEVHWILTRWARLFFAPPSSW
jgi:hypothetical protein